jgi:rRNA-processing protein FCF1
MRALLDTNFLMIPGEFRVDIFSELLSLGYIDVFTLDLVVKELEKFSTKGGKVSRAARLALELIRNCDVTVLKTKGDVTQVDSEIFRLAREKGYVICTQDRDLIKKINEAGMRFVTLRQGKYLVETGGL